MRIFVKTPLKYERHFDLVKAGFNESLFRHLTSGGPLKVVRYDGEQVGDEIHLQFFFPWKARWVSVIAEREEKPQAFYFIDEGKRLPFGLKQWKHVHKIIQEGNTIYIEDDIRFTSGRKWYDALLYLAFLPQFKMRKRQYNSYYSGNDV